MKIKLLSSLMLVAALGLGSMALAEGMEGMKAKTVKMKGGKEVTIMVGMMHGKMMAVIPMEELEELYQRAEGHSMDTSP